MKIYIEEAPKSFQDTLKEVLAISNPNEALIKIVTNEALSFSDAEDLLNAYMTEHDVTDNEMCFYPDGEMVLPPGIVL